MATDQTVLPYTTLIDIFNNYSSTDARAMWIWAARILDRMCPLIRVMPMIPSNNMLSNVATRTDSIPSPTTRRFNEGISPTTSHNVPINDPIALFEDYSEIDKSQCDLQNDPTAWRQGPGREPSRLPARDSNQFWYGALNTDPGGFNGLATRFNNLESIPNGLSDWQPNVERRRVDGIGDQPVAGRVRQGQVYGIYPPNTAAGLNIRDGETTGSSRSLDLRRPVAQQTSPGVPHPSAVVGRTPGERRAVRGADRQHQSDHPVFQ